MPPVDEYIYPNSGSVVGQIELCYEVLSVFKVSTLITWLIALVGSMLCAREHLMLIIPEFSPWLCHHCTWTPISLAMIGNMFPAIIIKWLQPDLSSNIYTVSWPLNGLSVWIWHVLRNKCKLGDLVNIMVSQ